MIMILLTFLLIKNNTTIVFQEKSHTIEYNVNSFAHSKYFTVQESTSKEQSYAAIFPTHSKIYDIVLSGKTIFTFVMSKNSIVAAILFEHILLKAFSTVNEKYQELTVFDTNRKVNFMQKIDRNGEDVHNLPR